MNRATSVDDIVGGLWKMGRTDSEAAFQDFLTRVPSGQHLNLSGSQVPSPGAMYPPPSHPIETSQPDVMGGAQQYFQNAPPPPGGAMHRVASIDLLRRLVMNQHMAPGGMPAPSISGHGGHGPPVGPPPGHLTMEAMVPPPNVVRAQPPESKPTKAASVASQGASGDSGEEDEDNNKQKTLSDIRRARRMLSNRESARRSRRRKQEHLSTLEDQIKGLEGEKSAVEEKLSAMEARFHESQKLVEELRAELKRLGAERGGAGGGRTSDSGKMERTPSMQRVASMEHMTKKTRNGSATDLAGRGGGASSPCRDSPGSIPRRGSWRDLSGGLESPAPAIAT